MEYVEEIYQRGLSMVQLHGSETKEFCQKISQPFIKVCRPRLAEDVTAMSVFDNASYFLLDAFDKTAYGGTGKEVAAPLVREAAGLTKPFILAGGLHSKNIVAAVKTFAPFAVDLSSGVEVSPGIKSGDSVRELFETVKRNL